MALYARPSWKLARQVSADLFVVAWTIAWCVVSWFVHRTISAVAQPARDTAAAAIKARDGFLSAGNSAAGVPLAGAELRKPFDTAAASLNDVITAANQQVTTIEQVASVVAIVVVVMPVSVLLAFWLPARWRFHRTSSAAKRFIDSDADVDLFALRAMANQPMAELGRISDDPVGDWRAGDPEVIRALADLELRRSGLSLPPPRSG
ncbi:hypothetical protein [Enemella evansiae]|uniref:Uncharacterized protein n=1 Tax=Enemella evansiae TaxID=2016499 RepID=A0A255G5I1_9ACTN|nr:hypothetical protein [Enemella evansiae]OYO09646.1 hypothetical protein CGZ94_18510 [Enemella evansiae]OYO15120.1 hypothetical protein CGZ98_01350 [Enemella evansiae]OYO20191.1 hypothetical protein BI335_01070 [Enemella evansiae]TDO92661.1 hypothetical protein C8D81_0422 [Enemella evansiae]